MYNQDDYYNYLRQKAELSRVSRERKSKLYRNIGKGLLGVGALGVGAYVISKGRVKPKQIETVNKALEHPLSKYSKVIENSALKPEIKLKKLIRTRKKVGINLFDKSKRIKARKALIKSGKIKTKIKVPKKENNGINHIELKSTHNPKQERFSSVVPPNHIPEVKKEGGIGIWHGGRKKTANYSGQIDGVSFYRHPASRDPKYVAEFRNKKTGKTKQLDITEHYKNHMNNKYTNNIAKEAGTKDDFRKAETIVKNLKNLKKHIKVSGKKGSTEMSELSLADSMSVVLKNPKTGLKTIRKIGLIKQPSMELVSKFNKTGKINPFTGLRGYAEMDYYNTCVSLGESMMFGLNWKDEVERRDRYGRNKSIDIRNKIFGNNQKLLNRPEGLKYRVKDKIGEIKYKFKKGGYSPSKKIEIARNRVGRTLDKIQGSYNALYNVKKAADKAADDFTRKYPVTSTSISTGLGSPLSAFAAEAAPRVHKAMQHPVAKKAIKTVSGEIGKGLSYGAAKAIHTGSKLKNLIYKTMPERVESFLQKAKRIK